MKYKGLNEEEVKKRIETYGLNEFSNIHKKSLIHIVIDQFQNVLLILLLFGAVLSWIIGDKTESIVIIFTVFVSVIFGTYLEYKADKSLEKLRKMNELKAVVIRDDKHKIILSKYIVPGDIVVLNAGSIVPSDGVLLTASDLKIDESVLTGESKAIYKQEGDKVYSGTTVLNGYGIYLTRSTGYNTEFGKITKSLKTITSGESHLKSEVRDISNKITLISLTVILVVFIGGLLKNYNIFQLIIFAISLAIAAIPEGLITVLTVILALGVSEMVKINALVRRLSVIENIGMLDVVCTDKTGTLTEGKLKLVYGDKKTIKAALYASFAKYNGETYIGDDIDIAIKQYADKNNITIKNEKLIKIIPFSPQRKYVLVKSQRFEIVKGAPEVLTQFTNITKKQWNLFNELTSKGLRVIGVVKDGKFLGFLGFRDEPKKGVKEAIKSLYSSGVDIIMITGDNLNTAKTIANELGIKGEGINWEKVKKKSDDELFSLLKSVKIIARAMPIDKLRIVEILKKNRLNVGVTGDGINDAPALKKADVGITMGKTGTDVSKEVADMVLLDDNFNTIVNAIAYGRNTFLNIISFIKFQLTISIAILMLIILAFLFTSKLPLTPIQVLWINILMDGPPAIALGFEKIRKEAYQLKPKNKQILSNSVIYSIFFTAFLISLISYMVFNEAISYFPRALTLTFNVLVFFQIYNALNVRSMKHSFIYNLTSNKILLIILLIVFGLQLFINFSPDMRIVFSLVPLSLRDWVITITTPMSILILEEIRKKVNLWTSL